MKNCQESLEILYRFIDHDLDGNVSEEIEFHLKRCGKCWDRFSFERKLRDHFRNTCCKEEPSEKLLKRIKSLLEHY